MARGQVPLFAFEANDLGVHSELEQAAEATINALREQGAIQAWHELDCAIALEAARGAALARGVAKAQMLAALLQARAKLPEPVITEATPELVEFEARRELDWTRAHSADVLDAEVA